MINWMMKYMKPAVDPSFIHPTEKQKARLQVLRSTPGAGRRSDQTDTSYCFPSKCLWKNRDSEAEGENYIGDVLVLFQRTLQAILEQ